MEEKTKLAELEETEYGNSKNPNRNKNNYRPIVTGLNNATTQ